MSNREAAAASERPLRMSEYEQEYLLSHPDALALLMDYHDMQQDQADSMGAECHGDKLRTAELKAIGAAIVREDPELWRDEILRRFGIVPLAPQDTPKEGGK